MNNVSLGVYDTGLGGLVILKEFIKIFPNTSMMYFADTEALPLGNKTKSEIQSIAKKAVDYLFQNGCTLIILACNTASVTSIRELQQNYIKVKYPNKNVLGINIPLIENLKENYSNLRNSTGVILSTEATHSSYFYQEELKKNGFNNILSIPCRNLATIIENGNSGEIQAEIDNILATFSSKQTIKFVVLACTHYPLIINQIKKRLPSITIISQGVDIAQKLMKYLDKHPEYKFSNGNRQFLTTKRVEGFDKKASVILGENESFKLVDY